MKRIIIGILAIAMAASFAGCGKKSDSAEEYADKLVSGEIEPDVKIVDRTEAPEEVQPAVNLALSDEDMGKLVDAAGNEYKSFTIQDIDSPYFFIGKTMRMVATIQDHQMTNVYASDIETKFERNSLSIKYTSEDKPVEQEYIVYAVADKVVKSPENRQFSYVAYGDKEITSETTDGTIGVLALIKMRDDIDMGEAKADNYVMLMETSNNGVYQILKVID